MTSSLSVFVRLMLSQGLCGLLLLRPEVSAVRPKLGQTGGKIEGTMEMQGQVVIKIDSKEFPEMRDVSAFITEAGKEPRWVALKEQRLDKLDWQYTEEGRRVDRMKFLGGSDQHTEFVFAQSVSLPCTIHKLADPQANGMVARSIYNSWSTSYDFVITKAGTYVMLKDGEDYHPEHKIINQETGEVALLSDAEKRIGSRYGGLLRNSVTQEPVQGTAEASGSEADTAQGDDALVAESGGGSMKDNYLHTNPDEILEDDSHPSAWASKGQQLEAPGGASATTLATQCLRSCESWSCDDWIISDRSRYTCKKLKDEYGCDCHGCSKCEAGWDQ